VKYPAAKALQRQDLTRIVTRETTMNYSRIAVGAVLISMSIAAPVCADTSKVILPMKAGAEGQVTASSSQVTTALSTSGLTVTIQPGADNYPGINIKPRGASWDLSAFGHVEARITNTGAKPISIALRVDNDGNWQDNPWNTESITIDPGKSGTAKTIFGYAYGLKPGYALKPNAIVNMVIFTGKSDEAQSFRIESITAAGPAGEAPPVAPGDVRVKPKDGSLLNADTTIDSNGLQTAPDNSGGLRVTLPASATEQSLSIKPRQGRWDLRDFTEVKARLRNESKAPISPRMRLDSNGGQSDWVTGASIAPGATAEIAVPFAGITPANLNKQGTGSRITSDAVSAFTITVDGTAVERSFRVIAIAADTPKPALPAWPGKRPPVNGEWVKTLDDEFDGTSLNKSIWSIYGDNYWDKQTHWSKDDVILGGGVVKLRYEKKTGFNNDDPAQKPSDYAAGYLHTYDKWTQRYGYFEARMKLPSSPGLWPAFWMMPDRGDKADPQWKRQDTANGGMEFDIMEHLTRWGGHRYNIAMHYDGYGKDHKNLGSDKIYIQPDKDGFITCGLLWTPGSAVYYANGREVLRWIDPRISNVPAMLMFTLPMGGWDNSPLDDNKLPDDFTIDYVRVWQRKDLSKLP